MLFAKLQEAKDLTAHERDVAQYILAHPEEIANFSSDDLAKATLTSKATVVRLAKRMGLSGYREMKLCLVAEYNQNQRINRILEEEPITAASSYEEIVRTLPILYDKAVTNTRMTFHKKDMIRIRNFLQTADCIDLYATGVSYMLAQAAAFKFKTLGMESSAYESINSHYLAARHHKKTLAFVISFTGANRNVEQMARYLRQATNHHVVGILGPHHEVTEKWCHEVIEVPNRDSVLSLDVITSYAATNYVLDVFFSMILPRYQENHVRSSLEMQSHQSILLNQ